MGRVRQPTTGPRWVQPLTWGGVEEEGGGKGRRREWGHQGVICLTYCILDSLGTPHLVRIRWCLCVRVRLRECVQTQFHLPRHHHTRCVAALGWESARKQIRGGSRCQEGALQRPPPSSLRARHIDRVIPLCLANFQRPHVHTHTHTGTAVSGDAVEALGGAFHTSPLHDKVCHSQFVLCFLLYIYTRVCVCVCACVFVCRIPVAVAEGPSSRSVI